MNELLVQVLARIDTAIAVVHGLMQELQSFRAEVEAALPEPDVLPPSIPQNVRMDGTVLRWDDSTDNAGVAGYSVHLDGQWFGATLAPLLVVGESYGRFEVFAYDGATPANYSAPAAFIRTAPVPADTTAPTRPGNVTLDNGILSWDGSIDPESGVKQYKIRRDSTRVATVPHTGADRYFMDITSYGPGAYRVSAVDNALNESAQNPAGGVQYAPTAPPPDGFPTSRELLLWPGSTTSIWNTPIAMNATYRSMEAHAPAASGGIGYNGVFADLAFLFLNPDAPLTEVRQNFNGFGAEYERCNESGPVIDQVPCDPNYVMPTDWTRAGKNKPNAPGAFIMPDGRTVRYFAPIGRCRVGGPITARQGYQGRDFYVEGQFIDGPMTRCGHGGSHLNSFAGVWRIHEVDGPIRHALQITMPLRVSYPQPVWPASNMEAHAPGTDPLMSAGTLYAIPPTINVENMGLETQPAKYLAQALQDYGAYATDTIPDSMAVGFRTEQGPAGHFEDVFQARWGFRFRELHGTPGGIETYVAGTPWGRDIRRICDALHVVTSNTPSAIGGGTGIRRAPPAPAIS